MGPSFPCFKEVASILRDPVCGAHLSLIIKQFQRIPWVPGGLLYVHEKIRRRVGSDPGMQVYGFSRFQGDIREQKQERILIALNTPELDIDRRGACICLCDFLAAQVSRPNTST